MGRVRRRSRGVARRPCHGVSCTPFCRRMSQSCKTRTRTASTANAHARVSITLLGPAIWPCSAEYRGQTVTYARRSERRDRPLTLARSPVTTGLISGATVPPTAWQDQDVGPCLDRSGDGGLSSPFSARWSLPPGRMVGAGPGPWSMGQLSRPKNRRNPYQNPRAQLVARALILDLCGDRVRRVISNSSRLAIGSRTEWEAVQTTRLHSRTPRLGLRSRVEGASQALPSRPSTRWAARSSCGRSSTLRREYLRSVAVRCPGSMALP